MKSHTACNPLHNLLEKQICYKCFEPLPKCVCGKLVPTLKHSEHEYQFLNLYDFTTYWEVI